MIRRHITGHLLQALADTPAVLVNGARQTGKSTLVQSAELVKPGRQYPFDDPGVLAAAKRDPRVFFHPLSRKTVGSVLVLVIYVTCFSASR